MSTVGPAALLRPAVDAALSRHLLPVPSPDRLGGDGGRSAADRHHARHRISEPQAGARRRRASPTAAWRWPRRAGATPRSSRPWAWRGRLAGCGASTTSATSRAQQRVADIAGGLAALSQDPAHDRCSRRCSAIGAWLVINQQATGRHHHRQLDPDVARAGAGRGGDRQLARLRRRAPELAPPATGCWPRFPPSAARMELPTPQRHR